MRLALKFPDIFGAVVGQSGESDMPTFLTPQMLVRPDGRHWYAATLPNPDNPPDYFDKPYELVNGKVQIIPELFQKTCEQDVMHEVDRYLNQPVRLNGIKVVHGRADNIVPIAQGKALHKKLTDLGIDHVYVEHGGKHVFIPEESLQFLSDHLHFTPQAVGIQAVKILFWGRIKCMFK